MDITEFEEVERKKKMEGKPLPIPDLDIEDFEIPDVEETEVPDESGGAQRVAFVGSGQGGCRIAKVFHDIGYRKAIALNTAEHDLEPLDMPVGQKYLMESGEVGGAGKDMRKGERAADEHRSEIFRLMCRVFGETVDHVLVTIGGGGGTGGGSVVPLLGCAARFADYRIRDAVGNKPPRGERVGVIVTLPKRGEANSPSVASNAKEVVRKLYELASAVTISPLIIIDNDKIDRLYGAKLSGASYWESVNANIAGLFHVFNALANQRSDFTALDPADYASILRCGGCCILGVTKVSEISEDGIAKAIKGNLSKTLLASGFNLKTAKKAGVAAVCGSKIMDTPGLMRMLDRGFDMVSELTANNADVHRGIYLDDKETLRVYTIVSGLELCEGRIDEIGS